MSRESGSAFIDLEAHPELITAEGLNNFEGKLPGGFYRVTLDQRAKDPNDIPFLELTGREKIYRTGEKYRKMAPQDAEVTMRRWHSELFLGQKGKEFFATLESVLFKHITPEEYVRVHEIVGNPAMSQANRDVRYYEARERLLAVLLATYQELRVMGYTHSELTS